MTAQDVHRIIIEKDLNNRSYVELLRRGPKRQVRKELLRRMSGMGAKDVAYLILATLEVGIHRDVNFDSRTGEQTRPPYTSPQIDTEPYVKFILDHLYRARRHFFYVVMKEAYEAQDSPAVWAFMIGASYSP
jgi:hypothetical protein